MKLENCCQKDSALSYCYFFGSFAVSYAIEDSFIILHTPSGCHRRVLYLWSMHDNSTTPKKNISTNIIDSDVIFGTEEKLKEVILDVEKRYNPKVVFIVTSCSPEIIGFDYDLVIQDVESSITSKIVPIYSAGFRGNFLKGYMDSLTKIVDIIPSNDDQDLDENSVNIVGYFFDRYESDNKSDILELKRLIDGLNLTTNAVFLEGSTLDKLLTAGKAKYNIVFPYGKESGDKLKDKFDQTNISLNLPIGIQLSIDFIREIGKVMGKEKEAEDLIERELKYCIPKLQSTLHITYGKKAAIFSEPQKIPGLVSLLIDIGIEPVVIGIHQGTPEDVAEVKKVIKESGAYAYTPNIMIDPSRDQVKNGVRDDEVDFCLGSTVEAWDIDDLDIPVIQVSIPMFEEHAIYDSPIVGFRGSLFLVQKIANLLNKGKSKRLSEETKLNRLLSGSYFYRQENTGDQT